MARRACVLTILIVALLTMATPASARGCGHVVIFTTPGLTWSDIDRTDPPNLLDIVERGAIGSVSVRTNSSRTTYASGFATIGAGARVDGGQTSIGIAEGDTEGSALHVPSVTEISALAHDAGYGASPGALASATTRNVLAIGNSDLGPMPDSPFGLGRWAALAAMDGDGEVDRAFVGSDMLQGHDAAPYGVVADRSVYATALTAALELECSVIILDPGDLARADHWLSQSGTDTPGVDLDDAIMRADALLGDVMAMLDPERDLLLVVSPTSPKWEREPHLGIALALGPTFEQGSALRSASTRRPGIVTLPDVAPTVLAHLGAERPAAMNGRAWVADRGSVTIEEAIALDGEAVLVDSMRGPISTWYVVFQVAVYVFGIILLRAKGRLGGMLPDLLGASALSIVALPVSTYAAGLSPWHDDGALGLVASVLVVDAGLVALASLAARGYLSRFLILVTATTAVVVVDLLLGANLQLNTVLGYSPIVAGRFAGIGNIGFAVLGVSALLVASILLHFRTGGRWLAAALAVMTVAVVVDGAPQLGSDVGGILALVPSYGITAILLTGRRPTLKTLALFGLGAIAVLGAFLAVDLARPPEVQTHLARTFDDIQARGIGQLGEIVMRKARANLRVFTSTIWTYFVPPALAAMAYLLSRPEGRWRDLADEYPKLRAGLVGGLVLAIIGFALNDSGIVIPAVILSFLVPLAVLIHLTLEAEDAPPAVRATDS
ncbi:MAG TPA: hypothetical protein VNC78_05245 [Actinomycetota bacterium]|nr:hypothetical protein [Actinomycetota bacterium]